MMTEIYIKDTDIKKICGIHSFFMENEITAPENFNFIAKGNFDSECLEQLTEYLLENNYILGCFTFSSDINYIPYIGDIHFAKQIVIPEGIRNIRSRSIFNQTLDSLVLPSTLTEIESNSIDTCTIQKLEIKNSKFFYIENGAIKNSITNEIVIQLKNIELSQTFSEKEKAEWAKIRPSNSLSILCCNLWNEEIKKVKSEISKNVYTFTKTKNMYPLDIIHSELKRFPDGYKCSRLLPVDHNPHFVDAYLKYMNWETQTEPRRPELHNDENPDGPTVEYPWANFVNPIKHKPKILVYSTETLIPETVDVCFMLRNNGCEMFIPYLQLYAFFRPEEIQLVYPLIKYLQKNAYELTKKFINSEYNNEKVRRMQYEKIDNSFRQKILDEIEHTKSKEAYFKENKQAILDIAQKHNLEMSGFDIIKSSYDESETVGIKFIPKNKNQTFVMKFSFDKNDMCAENSKMLFDIEEGIKKLISIYGF